MILGISKHLLMSFINFHPLFLAIFPIFSFSYLCIPVYVVRLYKYRYTTFGIFYHLPPMWYHFRLEIIPLKSFSPKPFPENWRFKRNPSPALARKKISCYSDLDLPGRCATYGRIADHSPPLLTGKERVLLHPKDSGTLFSYQPLKTATMLGVNLLCLNLLISC